MATTRTIASVLDLLRIKGTRRITNYKYWLSPETKVLVTAESEWVDSQNGQFAVLMAVNVLCRLFPIITHLDLFLEGDHLILQPMPLVESRSLKMALGQLIKRIDPLCQVAFIGRPKQDYDAILSIGPSDVRGNFKVTIYSDGWLAYTSRNAAKYASSININPISAYVASILGCIEVFKTTFKKKVWALFPSEAESCLTFQRLRPIADELKFSTLDYSVNAISSPNPQLPSTFDLGEVHLVGLGAVGEALVYTLCSFTSIEGTIHLIDPDNVQWSNLNRYVCATRSDAEACSPKVDVAKKLLEAHHGVLETDSFRGSYDEFRELSQNRKYDLLISAVDNHETRWLIQRDLPKLILNAGALESMYSVSRVELGRSQCLICPDPKGERELRLLNTIASLTGIPTNEIEQLRRTNGVFEEEHIRMLVKHTRGSPTFPMPHSGMRFPDWLYKNKSELGLMGWPELNIPIPLTTILAGVLLAGEAIKEKYFHDHRLNSQFDHDIFCLPMSGLHRFIPPLPGCPFCSSKDVLRRYHEKYVENKDAHKKGFRASK